MRAPNLPLSERQMEVLGLAVEGLTYREIATKLWLSPHTVKGHYKSILRNGGWHSMIQAAAWFGWQAKEE
jgi:DNA-binding NarL/FixJ family response regulator